MIRMLNVCLVGCVLVAGTVMYSLEHRTRETERSNARLSKAIIEEKEQIKLLKAEWVSLTRPERIEQIASKNLGMVPLDATQILQPEELAQAIPERAPNALGADQSPVGELLESLR